ncbi:MAG TPA: transcription-repair coupling factor [Polyangia bacterium]|nr:transcription-repair coupling factor [Polyangia bacterium]
MTTPVSTSPSFDHETAPDQRGAGQALREIEAHLDAGARVVEVYGAGGSLGAALAARLAARDGAGLLVYVCADEDAAEARLDDLSFFLPPPPASDDPIAPPAALQLAAPEPSPYAEMQADRRALLGRMAALFRLARGFAPPVLVASASALFRRVVPRAPFEALCWTIGAAAVIDRDETIARLVRAGFSRASVVEDPGTFAVRGAVIDVFPPVYRHPVRIELFGDEVEGLRLYDAATQRTLRPLRELHLHPVRDTIKTAGADPRAKILAAADAAVFPSSKTRHILDQIDEGEAFFGVEALAPAFHARMETVFDYLPKDALLVVEDPEAVLEAARRQASKLRETVVSRRAEHRIALDAGEFVLLEDEARAALEGRPRVELPPVEVVRFGPQDDGAAPRVHVVAEPNTGLRAELQRARGEQTSERLAAAHPDAAAVDVGKPLRDRLRAWMGQGQRVRLVAPNRAHADRLAGLLAAWGLAPETMARGHAPGWLFDDQGETAGPARQEAAPLAVLSGPLARGFRLPADRLVLVAEEEIFGPRAHREPPTAKANSTPGLGDLGEITEGDAVVHDEHGIGRYRGLKKLTVRGVPQDFLHLEYDGGSVYVPVYRIGLCHRYSGGEVDAVRLDKLGGKTWADKRRRVSAEARKVAEELLQLYAQRAALAGHAFPAPDATFQEFEETFPFEETPDQARAIETVLTDMQHGVPMDRLICGDVGYGKTEVALRATLLAVLGGKQAALLAPTTVLAEQHLMTFRERFADFPVRVAGLSRFRGKAEQSQTIAALAAGHVDVVVGTHRVLSRDVRFKDLGLVVIDEEQRFGVAHKERLKELRTQVDVLTLTATPIPRTLQMSMGGLREISIIATPPADRLAIRTFVCRFDPALLSDALAKELARGGQIFYVHNRVEDIAREAEKVRALAPAGTRVAIGHGQMPEGELEKVMVDFVDGRFDVLVCTTIIESGLDIPRANTMIVNRADRFGLAQLYQLRGRIGRSRERAFCYLVVPDEGRMTPEAKARLAVLQRFTELGAGFQVATHDLEIRGAGELLGERQHGAVAAVGFETYAKILEEAVAELRGEPIKRELDPEITVDVPAFLPDDYLPDTGQRLDFYRRLAQARNEDDVRATLEELQDRYGPLPDEARLLGEVMVDKTLVRTLGAQAYELSAARVVLTLGEGTRLDPAKVLKLAHAKGSRWKLSPEMRLAYAFTEAEKAERMRAARARLGDLAKLIG